MKVVEYCCRSNLDLYDSPQCQTLATQAGIGRHLQLLSQTEDAIEVRLCEDGYLAWLPRDRQIELEISTTVYQASIVDRATIAKVIPEIIAFTKTAMCRANHYLWGGNLGPNYDCSGLMQAAYLAEGIWLPRDSYQQADFTQRISQKELLPGDLVFFAKEVKVNHVAMYLGEELYIHSSGKDAGRNGIGIDRLGRGDDEIGNAYYQQLWGFGRVMSGYQPR
jgi:hypothetical protein